MEPSLVISVADLDDGPRSVRFELSEAWVDAALAGSEASSAGPGQVEVELLKNGSQVMVRGHAELAVTMTCVRTLAPVQVPLKPDIFLMLSEALPDLGARRRERKPRRKKGRLQAQTPEKPAKMSHRAWHDDPELSNERAAQDTYDGEKVVLDTFVREFILLDLPMSPTVSDLPSEDKAAIPPAPSAEGSEPSAPLDPRLAPLAAIAERLREHKK